MDGGRIWNAAAATGRSLAELVCEGQTLELVDGTLLDSLREDVQRQWESEAEK